MGLRADINKLKAYFVSKDGGIVSGELTPDVTDTHNLGRSGQRWDTLYVREVVADIGGGSADGGDADTVDGFDAAQNPLPSNLLALDPQSTFPTSVYPSALLKDGSRALEGSLSVVAGATIDGIDVGAHTHTGSGSSGAQLAHGTLTGLDADDHPQYTQRAQDEIVTGDWMFTHLIDRSAGWQFLPDDKLFQAVPHNMIFTANETQASISLGAFISSEYAMYLYDDDTPTTYFKVGRGDNSITLHGTDSTYKMWAGASSAGSAPFHVKNDGSIFASAGEIAGWDIDTTSISKNDMELQSAGRIIAGTGNDIVQIDAADATWRIWAGHATASIAPFRVNKVGQMYMYDAFVTGTLKSQNFISGQAGFSLDSSGLAEFDQIIARGRLQAMVFAEAAISVASGKMVISDGAVLSADVADTDDYIIVDAPVFQQNDIIRLKPDAYRDEWMRITSPYTIVGGAFKHFVARGINSTEPTWTGPYDFYAGESVVRLGSAQQTNVGFPLSAGESGGEYGEYQTGGSGATTGGGYLILEGSREYGPFFGVAARYGPVFDQIVDVVRIGNLNGISTYTSEEWGVFFGDDNQYFSYDQTQGVKIEFLGTDVDSTIDKFGIKSEVLRIERTTSAPAYAVEEAKIWYEKSGSDLILKMRLEDDVSTQVERELGDMYRSVYDSDLDGVVESADNADTVDSIHANTTATANQLLALDGSGQLPASADQVDGYDAADLAKAFVGSQLSISSGAVTAVQGDGYLRLRGESDADDILTTINGGTAGDLIVVRADDPSSYGEITIDHGAGNILLASEQDAYFVDQDAHIILWYDSTNWIEVARGFGGAEVKSIQIPLGGSGAEIATDVYQEARVPKEWANARIFRVSVTADVSGSVQLGIDTASWAATPSWSNICGTDYPDLSSVQVLEKESFTGWTLTLTGGQLIRVKTRNAATTIQRVTVMIDMLVY